MGPDLAEPDPGRLPGGGADAHLGNRAVARVILDIDRGRRRPGGRGFASNAGVAQLAERLISNQDVAGSTPATRSSFLPALTRAARLPPRWEALPEMRA